MSLPSGTVTFLFTDIEGSTKLWEQHPEAMRVALQQHDMLMRQAITRHHGHVFKTLGDAFCVVFQAAGSAVLAAMEAQTALQEQHVGIRLSNDELLPLRVRMAVHTGHTEERDNDYFGPPLNRVARLLAIGHGGQVLLSEVTYNLLGEVLPPGAMAQDMGLHRLKDLQQSERVYQLILANLPGDFPPLRSLNSRQHNLPIQVTSFIGREREMEEIKAFLRTTRLLTLTGSGGAGKTRLAMQVAADLLDPESDGVWLVELAAITDAERVDPTVANTLNIREEPGRTILQTLTDQLRTKRMLLLLDNCEHVLDACASLSDTLIRHCPHITILASSRQALGISGELTYRVPSLLLPDPEAETSVEILSGIESIRLFSDRARFHQPAFAITTSNAPMLAQVCHQLDGIPLAIELAAARVRVMPVEQIADRLDDCFRLLTGGSRTALPRHQTLRAAIDWSYSLLPPVERVLLNRLSVFARGWSLEAAERVCADPSESTSPGQSSLQEAHTGPSGELWQSEPIRVEDWEILDLLTALVDKSLVAYEEQNGQARYWLLETLRQYLRTKLTASGEAEAIQRRHLAYFIALTEESERKTRGSEQTWWLERLDREHDNLRAALGWPTYTEEDTEAGLRLAGGLWWFWHVRGQHVTEGRRWLSNKLAEASHDSPYRAKALNGAAVLARNQGDYATARSLSEESLALKRRLQDKQGIAAALTTLATLALMQGDYADSRPRYEEALELERELGNRQGITAALIGLGNVALEQGAYVRAKALYQESLELKQQLGDKRGIAASLGGLGNVAFAEGRLQAARQLHEESLAIRRHLQDKRNIATSLQHLGSVASALGEHDPAEAMFTESLEIRQKLGDKLGVANAQYGQGVLALRRGQLSRSRQLLAECLLVYQELDVRRGMVCTLNTLAYLLAEQGNAELAVQLLGLVEAVREELGSPLTPNELPEYERVLRQLQETLGPTTFANARAEGRNLTLSRAMEIALQHTDI